MAPFNPQVAPTQDPNYLNYSRAIDAPSPNMSGKIGLETAAAGLEGAVSVVDTSIKRGISDTAYAKVDKLRNDYTDALVKVKGDLDQGVIPAPTQAVGGKTTGSLLDANASMDAEPEDLPAGLESGLGRISQLSAAKAAGSPRLNDTQYSKDTLSVAKQLRAQFPGYREYIDQKVSEASGLPVANSYYQNMLQDINRQLTQLGKTKDDVGNLMVKNLDVPRMPEYIARRKAGDPTITDAMIYQKVGDWQNLQSQQKIDAAKRAESTDSHTVQVQTAEGQFTDTTNKTVQLHVQDVTQLSGMAPLGSLIKYFDDVSAGKISQTDAEVDQRKAQLATYRNTIYRQLKDQASSVEPLIGNDKSEKIIQNAMKPIDTMIEFANSKETGPAFFHARQIEAIKADSTHNFLINKDTSAISRQMMGARSVMGETYFPEWIKSILTGNVDQGLKSVFSEEAMNAVQPIEDARGQPLPRYMKDAIKHGKDIGAAGDSGYYGSVTGLVSKVADPKMPMAAKDRLIDWAFNQKNVGRLNELKMDYVDPNTGQPVPGKYRMFNILSAPAITDSVAETASVHPENYQKYKSTLEQEFGSLYRQDVKTLSTIMQRPSLGVHFSWDEGRNEFGLVDKNSKPIAFSMRAIGSGRVTLPDEADRNNMLEVLERVNGGIRNLSYVHKKDPQGAEDTSKYILQTLQTIGFRPGENITGATSEMMKAVIKSRAPDMTPAELDKAVLSRPGGVKPTATDREPVDLPPVQPLEDKGSPRRHYVPDVTKFAPEDDASLSAFLRSPAGNRQGPPPPVVRGNLSDEKLLSIDTKDIPENMTAREYIRQLKAGK